MDESKANTLNEEGITPLMLALLKDNFKQAEEILEYTNEKNISLPCKSFNNNTPLHVAAAKNKFKLVKKIVERGGEINKLNSKFFSPLYFAIKYGSIYQNMACSEKEKITNARKVCLLKQIIVFLLENGADPDKEITVENKPILKNYWKLKRPLFYEYVQNVKKEIEQIKLNK